MMIIPWIIVFLEKLVDQHLQRTMTHHLDVENEVVLLHIMSLVGNLAEIHTILEYLVDYLVLPVFFLMVPVGLVVLNRNGSAELIIVADN